MSKTPLQIKVSNIKNKLHYTVIMAHDYYVVSGYQYRFRLNAYVYENGVFCESTNETSSNIKY